MPKPKRKPLKTPPKAKSTAKTPSDGTPIPKKEKNPAAVALGRLGGTATAKKLTAEQRKASARKAALARWKKSK